MMARRNLSATVLYHAFPDLTAKVQSALDSYSSSSPGGGGGCFPKLNWSNINISELPELAENEPIKKFARGFVEAWRLYKVKEAIIVFVVLDWEKNFADQRNTEYEIIRQEKDIKIRRCTLEEMHRYGRADENKVLYL